MNKQINKELIKRGLSIKSNKIHPKKYSNSERFINGRVRDVKIE